ncbi:hypothetical protein P7D22_19665 [Lichenihabitans sp. Uapishka_5]|uniref:hypothetical protein n=1 Tax=Lichenihabitans sp. Uapishka_5 TaxID=3037302 RepID=UPI0029E7EBBC|nr:hypothetical protein [Lichenihabitans sp. Uapishka_5]MDX7953386.1 hypothetical protein [Lichenihabitans sp. Uapishka_5]
MRGKLAGAALAAVMALSGTSRAEAAPLQPNSLQFSDIEFSGSLELSPGNISGGKISITQDAFTFYSSYIGFDDTGVDDSFSIIAIARPSVVAEFVGDTLVLTISALAKYGCNPCINDTLRATLYLPFFVSGEYNSFGFAEFTDALGHEDFFFSGYDGSSYAVLSAVPLPASAPMFGTALLGLCALGYGMKRRSQPQAA